MSSKSKIAGLLAGILLVAVSSLLWMRPPSSGISVGTSTDWRGLLNVHASPVRWISVSGIRIRHVRGAPPYYMMVPGTDFVFFMTENPYDHITVAHFFDQKSRDDVAITEGDMTGLTLDVGGTGQPGSPCWIEHVDLPRIQVMTESEGYRNRFDFDVRRKTVMRTLVSSKVPNSDR
jgi:hypothetical protein